jgi:hypothetical protein
MKQQSSPAPAYCCAFLLLCFVMGELHEQAHIQTGYLLFGGYGPRNFHEWRTAGSGRIALLATAAGPLFSYLQAWVALWLIRRPGRLSRAWGLVLLFASLPFAHIFTALVGSGDEQVLVKTLFPRARWLMAAWVILLYGIPVLMAIKALPAKGRWLWLSFFLLMPMIVEFLLVHRFLNGLLDQGWGGVMLFGGTPLAVQLYFLGALLLLFCLRGAISRRSPQRYQQVHRLSSSF